MGWKIYFWFVTLIMIAGTGLSMAESLGIILPDEGDPSERVIWMWWEWLYLPILGISITGLFGFAYKKTLGEKQFWKGFFIFLVIADTLYTVYEYNIGVFDTEEMWRPTITFSLLIAIFLPYYVALYLYGFKSDALWNPPTDPNFQASPFQ